MKFIGQYIQGLIARFRDDVYLEGVSTGTIASGGNLGLDSNNKIVKATSTSHDEVTLAGTPDYITISGQEITRNAVDLAADITGTLPLANGGTGQTSAQAAMNALAGAVNDGRYLRGNGSNVVMAAIQNSDIGTLNQNTTGSAATLTTAREIGGTSFDGSADIAVAAATNLTASTSTAVQLGTVELGHANDTTLARSASGIMTVEGKEVRTADRQIQAVYSSFSANDINTKHYLSFNDGDSENTDHSHVDMPIVAPTAGKLLSVSMRQTRNTSTHDYTIRLETQAVGVTHATGPSIVGTVTGTKYFFTCLFEWDYSSI